MKAMDKNINDCFSDMQSKGLVEVNKAGFTLFGKAKNVFTLIESMAIPQIGEVIIEATDKSSPNGFVVGDMLSNGVMEDKLSDRRN